jgi:pyruvate/2-oxoglutarate/acetoin dehydrogenase E1 component
MPPPYNPNLEKKLVPQIEDIVRAAQEMVS